jgi:pimeloyl-ACP methyl ester carboxylesterase
MKQTYFGPPQLPLFGILHSPAKAEPGAVGVVIAPPFANEYFRSYRSLKILGDRLAKLGLFVLRFDFCGTGDSGGDDEDINLLRWREDLLASIEVLRQETGVERVHLVGRRLGAALCLEAAATIPEIERVVLWDPVLNGHDYVAEILKDQHEFVNSYRRTRRSMQEFESDLYSFEALGQCFPRVFVNQLEELDLESGLALNDVHACFVDSSGDSHREPSSKLLEQAGAKVDYYHVKDALAKDYDNLIRVYLPNPILRTITEWFAPAST